MDSITAWTFVTRWGNAVLLLPVAAGIAASLWIDGNRSVAWRWAWACGSALAIVLATKIAFLGWGFGSRALDFTGISGHSTLASSVLPMLAWWLTQGRSSTFRRGAISCAVLCALLVGLSRIFLSTHSVSEVVGGLALGSAAAAAAVPRVAATGIASVRNAWLRGLVAAAFVLGATASHAGDTDLAHDLVTRLSLDLSGRHVAYTRAMLWSATASTGETR